METHRFSKAMASCSFLPRRTATTCCAPCSVSACRADRSSRSWLSRCGPRGKNRYKRRVGMLYNDTICYIYIVMIVMIWYYMILHIYMCIYVGARVCVCAVCSLSVLSMFLIFVVGLTYANTYLDTSVSSSTGCSQRRTSWFYHIWVGIVGVNRYKRHGGATLPFDS